MAKGKFIVIEGVRGAGKSTIISHLKEAFSDAQVEFTREPGGTPLAEKIREVMMSEDARQADGHTQFGLIWASRAEHMKNRIIPTLLEGRHVITDRFDTSTYGLQLHAQESLHLRDLFFDIRKTYIGDFVPDIYIFLDVDPQEGALRVAKRDSKMSHFHDREPSYYERMRAGYIEFLQHVSHRRIDANQPLEKVKEECVSIIRELLRA